MSMQPERSGRDPWVDRLSEYLDGELSGHDRTALEAHLRSCATCSGALADLGAVVARARALVDLPPAEDLWPAIERRITGATPQGVESPAAAAGPVRPRPERDRAWWGRRFDLGLPQLAAAAVLLIAMSAGAVWLALRSPVTVPAPVIRPIARRDAAPPPAGEVSRPADAAAGSGDVAPAPAVVAVSNPRYDAAVAELEQALAEGRGRLDPRTLRVVEENLRIIDRALDEARRAVAADPGNLWLRSHLAATMKRKVDLLRSATLFAAEQG